MTDRKRRVLLSLTVAGLLLLVASRPAAAALIVGNNNDNQLSGTNKPDTMRGRGGKDVLEGLGRGDWMYGNDGNDTLRGGLGADHMFGNTGDDALQGGPGGDAIQAGGGTDHVSGGPGDDTIWIDGDGRSDTVVCGDGADVVYVTAGDGDMAAGDCESVQTYLVNDPPVAGDDAFLGAKGALANTRLVVGATTTGPHLAVAGSVLANDTDPDTPSGLTAGPANISSANCVGCSNVSLKANGTFTYDPPAGFVGTDTFTYTVHDNDAEAPANLTDTATVSIQVYGPLVWYVDIDAAAPPAGQGGRSHSPFQSLGPLTTGGSADALDGAGDVIFLGVDSAAPIAAYDGGIVLETNQKLWGEPFGLVVDPGGAGVGPGSKILVAASGGGAAGNPTVRNSAGGGIGITLASGVDIQRVNAGITGAGSATGIAGASVTTATIGTNTLVQGNTAGLSLSGAAGGNISVGAAINGNSGAVISVADRSSGTVTFSDGVTGGFANSAVSLVNNTGATIAFTGALHLNSTGADVTAFSASGGGTVSATNATNQVAFFSGTGISLNGVNIGAGGMTVASVATAGAANGVVLTNVGGAGAFTINSGSITATTRGLDVDGGSANVTVGASLTTSGASARSVEVTNRGGGTVDVNGLVTESSLGINLSANGTGLVRFDGGLTASTGANSAFSATVSGNVAVTGSANTLATTTATALTIDNTTIHADGLAFESISVGTAASGPANGIVLNTTGSNGSLSVTGTGSNAAGSGGTIQNVANRGVSAISTNGLSLSNMTFVNDGMVNGADPTDATSTCGDLLAGSNTDCNAAIHMNGVKGAALTNLSVSGGVQIGINGVNVTDLTLADSTVQNAGDQVREDGVRFTDLKGTSSITNSTLQGNEDNQLRIANGNGATGTLNISGSTFQNSTNPNGEYGFQLDTIGSGAMSTTVGTSTFTNLRGGALVVRAQNSSALNVTVSGGTWHGNSGVISNFDSAIQILGADSANVKFNVHDITNPMVGYGLDVIRMQSSASGSASLQGQVINTVIGDSSSTTSASTNGTGIAVSQESTSNTRVRLSGNTIRGAATFGIAVQMGNLTTDATSMDVIAQNNNVAVTNVATSLQGIFLTSGTTSTPAPGDAGTFCADISGNVATSVNADGLRLRQRFATTVQLPGYAGGASDTAAVNSYLSSRNTLLGDTVSSTTQIPGGFANGACDAPTLP